MKLIGKTFFFLVYRMLTRRTISLLCSRNLGVVCTEIGILSALSKPSLLIPSFTRRIKFGFGNFVESPVLKQK